MSLENVGVDYSAGQPNLLFTAVLPIAAAELSTDADDWPPLTPWMADHGCGAKPPLLDPIRAAVIAYWRTQLTLKTAALDFLPKYFTTSQVRSVYASIWGEKQAEGNFQRWLASARDADGRAVCEEVTDDEVRKETQARFAERMKGVGLTTDSVAKAWNPKAVGLSSTVYALGGLAAVLPGAVAAGAVVGSMVGWQLGKSTGRPPSWYRRTNEKRVDLKTGYPVRPPAIGQPPSVVG